MNLGVTAAIRCSRRSVLPIDSLLCSQELLVTPTLCTTVTDTGTPHQQGPHLEEVEFLLPIALLFCVYNHILKPSISCCLSTCWCYGRHVFKLYCSYCLSISCYIAHMLKPTGSSIHRGLMGTSYVSDSYIAHHGSRASRFISGTPTGVKATGTAIMDVDYAAASAAIEQ